MAFVQEIRRAVARISTGVAVVLVASALVGAPSDAKAAALVTFDFQSDAGDYIGGGATYHRTEAFGSLSASTLDLTANGVPDRVSIFLLGPAGSGSINLQLASDKLGMDLVPGTYLDAERAPFASPGHPGIDVSMDSRGCNTIAGSFVIHAIVFQGSTLRYLDMDFVQHCEGLAPALRGSVLYVDGAATTTTVVPSSAIVTVGSPVTLTATVTGIAPTGTVEFRDGLAVIGACGSVSLTGGGTAQCATSALGNGNHAISARYGGDASNLPSIGTTQVLVTLPGCAGFTDIDPANPFCQNVEWIRSRAVTLGCGANVFCPNDAVTRITMAAFIARLGAALTPSVLDVDVATGAIPLALSSVSCQSASFAVNGFNRRALATAVVGAKAALNVDMGIEVVASFDGGQHWTALSACRASVSAPTAGQA